MGFSLNPKKLVENVVHAPAKIAEKAEDVAHTAVDVAKAAPGIAKDAATEAYHTADYLVHNPPNLSQLKRATLTIGGGILSGKGVEITGRMPGYDRLDQAEHDAAVERGKGQSVEQAFVTGDRAGKSVNEPVSLEVTGSKDDLKAALHQMGWKQAPKRTVGEYATMAGKVLLGTEKNTNGPVSVQYLDGKSEEMAFNKNDDFNAGRDHMRIYHVGKDEKTGEDKWAIACSRDVKLKVKIPHPDVDLNPFDGDGISVHEDPLKFTHEIDKHVDRERDLVIHDLVKSGFVKHWDAVEGKRSGVAEEKLPDGNFKVDNDLYTDGRVYRVGMKKPV
jgi:hypothetical protein